MVSLQPAYLWCTYLHVSDWALKKMTQKPSSMYQKSGTQMSRCFKISLIACMLLIVFRNYVFIAFVEGSAAKTAQHTKILLHF